MAKVNFDQGPWSSTRASTSTPTVRTNLAGTSLNRNGQTTTEWQAASADNTAANFVPAMVDNRYRHRNEVDHAGRSWRYVASEDFSTEEPGASGQTTWKDIGQPTTILITSTTAPQTILAGSYVDVEVASISELYYFFDEVTSVSAATDFNALVTANTITQLSTEVSGEDNNIPDFDPAVLTSGGYAPGSSVYVPLTNTTVSPSYRGFVWFVPMNRLDAAGEFEARDTNVITAPGIGPDWTTRTPIQLADVAPFVTDPAFVTLGSIIGATVAADTDASARTMGSDGFPGTVVESEAGITYVYRPGGMSPAAGTDGEGWYYFDGATLDPNDGLRRTADGELSIDPLEVQLGYNYQHSHAEGVIINITGGNGQEYFFRAASVPDIPAGTFPVQMQPRIVTYGPMERYYPRELTVHNGTVYAAKASITTGTIADAPQPNAVESDSGSWVQLTPSGADDFLDHFPAPDPNVARYPAGLQNTNVTVPTAADLNVPDDLNLSGTTLQLRRGTTNIDTVSLASLSGGGGGGGSPTIRYSNLAANVDPGNPTDNAANWQASATFTTGSVVTDTGLPSLILSGNTASFPTNSGGFFTERPESTFSPTTLATTANFPNTGELYLVIDFSGNYNETFLNGLGIDPVSAAGFLPEGTTITFNSDDSVVASRTTYPVTGWYRSPANNTDWVFILDAERLVGSSTRAITFNEISLTRTDASPTANHIAIQNSGETTWNVIPFNGASFVQTEGSTPTTGGTGAAEVTTQLLEQADGSVIVADTTFQTGQYVTLVPNADTGSLRRTWRIQDARSLAITGGVVTGDSAIPSTILPAGYNTFTDTNAAERWNTILSSAGLGAQVSDEGLLPELDEPITSGFTGDDTPLFLTDGNLLKTGVPTASNIPQSGLPVERFSDNWTWFDFTSNDSFFATSATFNTNTLVLSLDRDSNTGVNRLTSAAFGSPVVGDTVTITNSSGDVLHTTTITADPVFETSGNNRSGLRITLASAPSPAIGGGGTAVTITSASAGSGVVPTHTNILDWDHPDYVTSVGTAATTVELAISDTNPAVATFHISASLTDLNTAGAQERSDILDVVVSARDTIINDLIGTPTRDAPVAATITAGELTRTLQFTEAPTAGANDTTEDDYISATFTIPVARFYGRRNRIIPAGEQSVFNGALTGQPAIPRGDASLTLLTFRRSPPAINTSSIQDFAVSGSKARLGAGLRDDNSFIAADVDDDTIEIAGNSIQVKDAGIDTDQLHDESVTGAKLAPGSVGNTQIANDAVGPNKIANDSVGRLKLDAPTRQQLDARGLTVNEATGEVSASGPITPTNFGMDDDWEMHIRTDGTRYITFTEQTVTGLDLTVGSHYSILVGTGADPTGTVSTNAVLRDEPITVAENATLTGSYTSTSATTATLSGLQINGVTPSASNTVTIASGTFIRVAGGHIFAPTDDVVINSASATIGQRAINAAPVPTGTVALDPIVFDRATFSISLDVIAGSDVGGVDIYDYLDALTPASTEGGNGEYLLSPSGSYYTREVILHTASGNAIVNTTDFIAEQDEFEVTSIHAGGADSRRQQTPIIALTGAAGETLSYNDVAVAWRSNPSIGEIHLTLRGNASEIDAIVAGLEERWNSVFNQDNAIYFNGAVATGTVTPANGLYIRVITNLAEYLTGTASTQQPLRVTPGNTSFTTQIPLISDMPSLPLTPVSAFFSNAIYARRYATEQSALVDIVGTDASRPGIVGIDVSLFGGVPTTAFEVSNLYTSNALSNSFSPDPQIPEDGSRRPLGSRPYRAGTMIQFTEGFNVRATITGPDAQLLHDDLTHHLVGAADAHGRDPAAIGSIWFTDDPASDRVTWRVGIPLVTNQTGQFLQAHPIRDYTAPNLIPAAAAEIITSTTAGPYISTMVSWEREGLNYRVTTTGTDQVRAAGAFADFFAQRTAQRTTLYFRSDGMVARFADNAALDAAIAADEVHYIAMNVPDIPGFDQDGIRITAVQTVAPASRPALSLYDQAGATALELHALDDVATETINLPGGRSITGTFLNDATNIDIGPGNIVAGDLIPGHDGSAVNNNTTTLQDGQFYLKTDVSSQTWRSVNGLQPAVFTQLTGTDAGVTTADGTGDPTGNAFIDLSNTTAAVQIRFASESANTVGSNANPMNAIDITGFTFTDEGSINNRGRLSVEQLYEIFNVNPPANASDGIFNASDAIINADGNPVTISVGGIGYDVRAIGQRTGSTPHGVFITDAVIPSPGSVGDGNANALVQLLTTPGSGSGTPVDQNLRNNGFFRYTAVAGADNNGTFTPVLLGTPIV